MNTYRIGTAPATYHMANVASLKPGDFLYVISRQDRAAHVIDSIQADGDYVAAQVKCQGRIWTAHWHKTARLAVLRKAA